MNKLNFIQWNGRSVMANKGYLEYFIHENNIGIGLLSETWFKPGTVVSFQGYNVVRKDRDDGKGGVAIIIKKNTPYSLLKVNNNIADVAVCAVTIYPNPKESINIYSVYVKPQSRITSMEWELFFKELKKPFIIGGDFNMHHRSWGCSWSDNNGVNLLSAMDEFNVSFLNNGEETIVKKINQINRSVIDLTLCNAEMAPEIKWEVNCNTLGSDHYAIVFSINYSKDNIVNNQQKNWNLHKADWKLFSDLVENYANIDSENINYQDFLNNLNIINKKSIPEKKKVYNKKFSKIWWNIECKTVIEEQREALKRYKDSPTFDNLINVKKISAKVKKTIKLSKREAWKKFCSDLNKNTKITDIWNQIKKIKNCVKEQSSPLVEGDWLEIFINTISPLIPQENIETPLDNEPENELTKKFNMAELERCIKKNKNSAPGIDKIHYPMISNLPMVGKQMLLSIYNNIWQTGEIPQDWKKYLIVPILKPHKDPKIAKSYRAISLASCLLKTYERMIKNRLEKWLEINRKIPRSQYGFRKRCSTYENISHLILDINNSFANKKALIAIFIDIEGAYDNVNIKILYKKMVQLGIPKKFAYHVANLYINREIYIKINNDIKGPRLCNIGIPQGGILSPLLYIIYTIDIEGIINNNVKIIQYADDVCIYQDNCEIDQGIEVLNNTMNKLDNWAQENGLSINQNKTQICIFTKKRKNTPLQATLNNKVYDIKDTVHFLGLTMDKKLLWKNHIHNIVTKCEKALNILKMVTHLSWGADPNISILLYKSYVRSVMDYGAIFYDQASLIHLNKIDKIQSKILRLCLGLMKSSPINNILAESQEIPLAYRRTILCSKYVLKLYSKNSELINKIHRNYIMDLTHSYWREKKSLKLIQCYANVIKYEHIYHEDVIPYFKMNLETTPQTHYFRNYENCPSNLINHMFSFDLNTLDENQYALFTDGSKTIESTSCAFYDPQKKTGSAYKLYKELSIYNAELIAILEALKYINTINIINYSNHFIILTDSKSAIDIISNILNGSKTNYIIVDIINRLGDLQQIGKKVTLAWIKGHCGIENNEIVDKMARKAASSEDILNNYYPTPEDIFVCLKNDILKEWRDKYLENNKGKYYKEINYNPISVPWYRKTEYINKHFTRTICRLRINHGTFPSHLYKIGMAETDRCNCGEEGSSQHLILECKNRQNSIKPLLEELYTLNIKTPFNLKSLLAEGNFNIYLAIYKYILREKIKI